MFLIQNVKNNCHWIRTFRYLGAIQIIEKEDDMKHQQIKKYEIGNSNFGLLIACWSFSLEKECEKKLKHCHRWRPPAGVISGRGWQGMTSSEILWIHRGTEKLNKCHRCVKTPCNHILGRILKLEPFNPLTFFLTDIFRGEWVQPILIL